MVARTPNRVKREAFQPSQTHRGGLKVQLSEANENRKKGSNFSSLKKGRPVVKKRGEETIVRKKKKKSVPEKSKAVVEDSSISQKDTNGYVDENTLAVLSTDSMKEKLVYDQKSSNQNARTLSTVKPTNKKKDQPMTKSGDSHGVDHPKLQSSQFKVDKFDVTPTKSNAAKAYIGDASNPESSRVSMPSMGYVEKTARTIRRRRRVASKNITGTSIKSSDDTTSANLPSTSTLHEKLKAPIQSTSKRSNKCQIRSISAPRGYTTGGIDPIIFPGTSRKIGGNTRSEPIHAHVEKKKAGASKFSRFRSVSTPRSSEPRETDPIFCVGRPVNSVPNGNVGCEPEQESFDRKKNEMSVPAHQENYPRISPKLGIHELREEAVCRGFERWQLPEKKDNLLALLEDGSIYLRDTYAWKEVERIKSIIEDEASLRKDPVMVKRSEADGKDQGIDKLPTEPLDRHKNKKIGRTEREKAKKQWALRSAEMEMNQVHHVHSHPNVHIHSLALTSTILMCRKPRSTIASCDDCGSMWTQCVYTCEKCNFDICKGCFDYRDTTAFLREEQLRKQIEKRENEHQEALAREKGCKRVEQIKWDAQRQFKPVILNPQISCRSPNGCGMKGYTVWCSHGDIRDGAIEMDFVKEFDTTWTTKEDANQRARYLFYWKNFWGLKPDELAGSGYTTDQEETEIDGLKSFWIDSEPDEGKNSFWIVSVVSDQAFANLPGPSTRTYDFDEPSICTIET
eukprot:scaffold1291_cov136-Amphora_coffeaeformis.AAC.5